MRSMARRYLPQLLVGIAISAIMIAAYAAVGFSASNQPKATWATNPVTITFSGASAHGTASDSFTCSPAASSVIIVSKSASSKVSLTATPSTFPSCGSIPNTVTLTATCLVPAAQCKGTFNGQAQIRQPANYRNIPANLAITIIVS